MKKVLLLLLFLTAASFAATTATPSLTLSVSNITDTIRPGSSFMVQVRVVNNGEGVAGNVSVEPSLTNQFKIKAGTPDQAVLGDMSLGQIATGRLYISVESDTPADVYDIGLMINYMSGKNRFSIKRTIAVNIEAQPTLEIIDAEYEKIYAGDYATLSLTLQNIGNGEARNIRAVYSNATGAILPAGSAVAYIPSLAAGKSVDVEIPLAISGNADAGTYSVNMVVSYEDQDGTPQSVLTRTIGLRIESDIELKTFLDSSTLVQGTPSEIVVSIANTGPNTAQFLEVTPIQAPGMKISPDSIYIGNLESDDFDTAEFDVTSSSAGKQQVQLKLIYKDQFNQEQEVTRKVGVDVLTLEESSALQETSMAPYGFLLIVLAGGAWYWRRRKKKA